MDYSVEACRNEESFSRQNAHSIMLFIYSQFNIKKSVAFKTLGMLAL